jgi:hypothetical protein
LSEDAKKYAPVLDRMIEILGSSNDITFGIALNRAASELGIEVPEHMHGPLLTSAFKVIAGGRIPGAPDA